MKKQYLKPKLDTKAFAQFENVFTACNKGNDGPSGCAYDPETHPGDSNWNAAFNNQNGS